MPYHVLGGVSGSFAAGVGASVFLNETRRLESVSSPYRARHKGFEDVQAVWIVFIFVEI